MSVMDYHPHYYSHYPKHKENFFFLIYLNVSHLERDKNGFIQGWFYRRFKGKKTGI